MNKYDFGYDLIPGTTNEWAYHQIENGSTILEIGASNGNLISHLTSEKNCIADIVEYNEEAGRQASQFARIAMVGNVFGDAEGDEWKKNVKRNKYDYIIILDVLEHLQKPQKLLCFLKNLLKDEGKLILSIPNIAHNSVIIDLMNNKFEYTEIGLLDNTHIHFFTYHSAKQMLNEAGFYTTFEDVRQVEVSETEMTAQYDDVPRNVAAFLRTRELGTAYQFLFCAGKKVTYEPNALPYHVNSPYEIVLFHENHIIMQKNINPKDVQSISVELPERITEMRIDPLNRTCIIRNWNLIGYDFEGNEVSLKSLETTGNTIDNITIFYDDDPQIYAVWQKEVVRCVFHCEFASYDDEGLYEARRSREYVRALENEIKLLNKHNVQENIYPIAIKSQLFLFFDDDKYEVLEGDTSNNNEVWTVSFSSENIKKAKKIRWDPLEGEASHISDIVVKGLELVPINAYSTDSGSYRFTTYDPQFSVRGDWSELHEIVIRFKCEILDWTEGYYLVERERNEERAKRLAEEQQWSQRQDSLETELVKVSDELVRTSNELNEAMHNLENITNEFNKKTSALDWIANEVKSHPWKCIAKILLRKTI